MPPSDFTRPTEGFRFRFGGMKLNARPDALPPNKYPVAVNVREFEDGTIRTRPGLSSVIFSVGQFNPTDIRAYAALGTNDLPRYLVRNSGDKIVDDLGVIVGNLAVSTFGGASMIPFRPNASPTPYMYIANGADYQKFSAPAGAAITQKKVGIAEPQSAPTASLVDPPILPLTAGPLYTAGGTAAASGSGTRISDTVGAAVFTISPGQFVFQVTTTINYQKFMVFEIASSNPAQVEDVFPPLATPISMSSIFYFIGNTGHCVLVLNTVRGQQGAEATSIYSPNLLLALRRNAIIKIGTEAVLVQSVELGADGTICVETSTVNTHTTADTVTIVPAVMVFCATHTPITGDSITDQVAPNASRSYLVNTGVGTQSTGLLGSNPFVNNLQLAAPDDYISMGFKVDVPANVTEFKLLFDVDDGSFTKNFYYFTVRANDLITVITNALTQVAGAQTVAQRALIDEQAAIMAGNQGETFSSEQAATGANQWAQIAFTIAELTRVGNDQTKSLMTFTAFQVLWNVIGNVNVTMDPFFIITGGSWPDVGSVGAPIRYRVRPRDSSTGVVGNPSPATRYGVNPRRQAVNLTLPSALYDPQIDTWDVFRNGGGIVGSEGEELWKFVGSTPSTNSTFLDNFSDDAVLAGDDLDFDNFEPWPSIDVPLNATATTVTGFIALVNIPSPTNVLGYLPGTLVQLGNINVYTLQTRPTNFSGTIYLFQFIENAGTQTNVRAVIQEPILAKQFLPYMWGPDANGNVFACGDPLRAGTLYFCKPYAPDSAPDAYNQEIVQPSEPLLGGEIIDGVSFVASTERWWRLYFQPENTAQRFSPVQEPIPRGLGAPFAHCNDGQSLYFWAKDGIYRGAESLTDADLYNLFPHESVLGQDVTYNGVTIKAPAYQNAANFRLVYSNGYLYAIYVDSSGLYHCLTLKLSSMAWCYDTYARQITAAYHVEQQSESNAVNANPYLIFGQQTILGIVDGAITKQLDFSNDNGFPIVCSLALREFDGGDVRAPKQWGDHFLDLVPAANPAVNPGVSVTPMSLGATLIAATAIPQSTNRSRNPISVGGTLVSDFMGLFLSWTDDFTRQSIPTQFFVWQPSFDIQPARTIAWKTFGSSFGLQGYGHIRQVAIPWVSTAPITLTITTFDGQSPQVITIPSSGGAYQKQLFPVSANKGQLFVFQATSPAQFQIFEDDIEIHVGAWNRNGAYMIAKSFGGAPSAQSPI